MSRLSRCAVFLAPLVFLFLFGSWVWWLEQPPDALPADAPAMAFSAERAMVIVRQLAQKPHRAGTTANDEVRTKLLGMLQSQGLDVVTDESTVTRGSTVANPRNIFARLPGTNSLAASGTSGLSGIQGFVAKPRAFLLIAHYDSVPYGPGAADDLSGVAAMLETLRAIKAGPPLTNDLILAFTDGEECGLLGAKGFAGHRWAKDVGCMLNFEARGVCGPTYLFEVGEPKSWLIPEIARSKAPVRTSSLMFEVYRRLPFTTDFHMLRDRIPGMNIAFIGRFPLYHSANDGPEQLDLRSLQHHGDYALAFTRHFGSIALDGECSKAPLTFFSIFGAHLFWYTKSSSLVLSMVILLLLIFLLRCNRNRCEPHREMAVRGITAWAKLLLVGAIVAGCVLGLGWLLRGPFMLYRNISFILAGCFFMAAAVLQWYAGIRRRLLLRHLMMGAYIFWAGGMLIQTLFMPEGAFIWQWPLFASLSGCFIAMICGRLIRSRYTSPAVFMAVSIPVLTFGVPLLSGFAEAVSVFILPFLAVCGILGCGLILPLIDRPVRVLKRPLTVCFLVAGVVLFTRGIVLSSPSDTTPGMSHLLYHLDADTNEALWCSVEDDPETWTRQFVTSASLSRSLTEISDHLLWQGPAPTVAMPAPLAEFVSQSIGSDSTRILRIRLSSPRGAVRMRIHGVSNVPTLSAAMNGIPLDIGGKDWKLDYSILPKESVELTLTIQSNATQTLVLRDVSYGFPVQVSPRPIDSVPMNNVLNRGSSCESDTTQMTRTYKF